VSPADCFVSEDQITSHPLLILVKLWLRELISISLMVT
jgi:hypothetical protein